MNPWKKGLATLPPPPEGEESGRPFVLAARPLLPPPLPLRENSFEEKERSSRETAEAHRRTVRETPRRRRRRRRRDPRERRRANE